MKKKIAFITTGYFPVPPVLGGAVESLIHTLILKNEKYSCADFTVYSADNLEAKKQSKKQKNTDYKFIKTPTVIKFIDITIYNIFTKILKHDKNMSYRYIFQRLWYENKVSIDLKKNDYDLVVVENTPASFLALKWRNNYIKYQGKYHYHLHNEVGKTFGCDEVIKNSASIIGVSDFINQSFKKQYPDFNGKLNILKNCIVVNSKKSVLNKESILKKYNIEKNNFIYLFAGRLSEEKGVLEVVKAFHKSNIPNSKLLVIGGCYYASGIKSSYEKKLYEYAENIPNVCFTGYVSHEDLIEFYKIANVGVFPSIWDEPAGLTIIEAMCEGLPVITTSSGGIPEYTSDNVIVLDRDENIVDNISENMKLLYSNTYLYNKMSKKSRECASIYTDEKYYREFIDICEVNTKIK